MQVFLVVILITLQKYTIYVCMRWLDFDKESSPEPVVSYGYPQGHTHEVGKQQVEVGV